jgi:hypothetical protein
MIRLRIKIKSLNGETYTNDEELQDDYMVSRQNQEFNKLIESNIQKSHIEELDSVKVTAYFGDM